MASSAEKQAFIQEITPIVAKYTAEYGYNQEVIPAIVAQACLESGYGTSNIANVANNYFGIKHGSKEYYTGLAYDAPNNRICRSEDISIYGDSNIWRVYDNLDGSVKGYFEFLDQDNLKEYYSEKLKPCNTAEEYAQKIAQGGYCASSTSDTYVNKIQSIINENNITEYCQNIDLSTVDNINFNSISELSLNLKNNITTMIQKLQNSYLSYDAAFLNSHLSTLMECINNTNFLNGITSNNYQSTVKSLKTEDSMILLYFNITEALLECIMAEIQNIIQAATEVEKTETNLQEEAEKLSGNQTSTISSNYRTMGATNVNPITSNVSSINSENSNPSPPSSPTYNESSVNETNKNTSVNEITSESEITSENKENNSLNDIDDIETPIDNKNNTVNETTSNIKKDSITSNQQDNYQTSKKNENGNTAEIVIGGIALAGMAAAGKTIYDKVKKDKEIEED